MTYKVLADQASIITRIKTVLESLQGSLQEGKFDPEYNRDSGTYALAAADIADKVASRSQRGGRDPWARQLRAIADKHFSRPISVRQSLPVEDAMLRRTRAQRRAQSPGRPTVRVADFVPSKPKPRNISRQSNRPTVKMQAK
jgi:hypothetical protein